MPAEEVALTTALDLAEPRAIAAIDSEDFTAAMTALAWSWNQIQRRQPGLAIVCRVVTLGALVYPLL